MTRTPPTIRLDSSIRAAPILLDSLRDDRDVFNTLSEVELCLIWYDVSIRSSKDSANTYTPSSSERRIQELQNGGLRLATIFFSRITILESLLTMSIQH